MPLIQVTLIEGRTMEAKAALIGSLTQAAVVRWARRASRCA